MRIIKYVRLSRGGVIGDLLTDTEFHEVLTLGFSAEELFQDNIGGWGYDFPNINLRTNPKLIEYVEKVYTGEELMIEKAPLQKGCIHILVADANTGNYIHTIGINDYIKYEDGYDDSDDE
jgi:hypothetical protein